MGGAKGSALCAITPCRLDSVFSVSITQRMKTLILQDMLKHDIQLGECRKNYQKILHYYSTNINIYHMYIICSCALCYNKIETSQKRSMRK